MIRVLLVEDDPMVAELNRLYVNRVEGFQIVASVRSAQEARANSIWSLSASGLVLGPGSWPYRWGSTSGPPGSSRPLTKERSSGRWLRVGSSTGTRPTDCSAAT